MILKTFTALTVSNLDNGTTTFSDTTVYQPTPPIRRLKRIVGGNLFDPFGSQATRIVPGTRRLTYVFKGANTIALHAHINNLMTVDLGKKGTLTFSGQDGHTYSQTAALSGVSWRPIFDVTHEVSAQITLDVEELTVLEQEV